MITISRAAQGVTISVLVQPGASRDRLCGEHGGRLKLSVSAPPEKGRANKAVCRLLAAELGLNRSQVRVISGHTSRQKEVLIERVDANALEGIIA